MNVTINDCIGQLEGVPPKVVDLMIANQVKQGNPANVKVFQEKIDASYAEGGFRWNKSNEGQFFWSKVINGRQFPMELTQPDKFNEDTTGTSESTLVDLESMGQHAYKIGDIVKVKSGASMVQRVVIGYVPELPNPYITISKQIYNNLKDGKYIETTANLITLKEPEKYVYLTLEDISNGKGVGVNPELIRIIR